MMCTTGRRTTVSLRQLRKVQGLALMAFHNCRYCSAWQFEKATRKCQLGAPDVEQGKTFRPDAIHSHVCAARVSGHPKVGRGLAPAD